MYEIDLEKAKKQLGDLIQTALDGEEVVIMENGKPILRLVRVPPTGLGSLRWMDHPSAKLRRQSGSAKGLISISDDFDEPLEDFGDYM